jgi:hypothetical protein
MSVFIIVLMNMNKKNRIERTIFKNEDLNKQIYITCSLIYDDLKAL